MKDSLNLGRTYLVEDVSALQIRGRWNLDRLRELLDKDLKTQFGNTHVFIVEADATARLLELSGLYVILSHYVRSMKENLDIEVVLDYSMAIRTPGTQPIWHADATRHIWFHVYPKEFFENCPPLLPRKVIINQEMKLELNDMTESAHYSLGTLPTFSYKVDELMYGSSCLPFFTHSFCARELAEYDVVVHVRQEDGRLIRTECPVS